MTHGILAKKTDWMPACCSCTESMKDDTAITVGVDVSKAHLDVHELPTGRAKQLDNYAAGITKVSRWISPEVDCLVHSLVKR